MPLGAVLVLLGVWLAEVLRQGRAGEGRGRNG